MEDEKIYIVAGNYRQAQAYAKTHKIYPKKWDFVEKAASIAAQVADALEEAHRRGIVHRDIKSENIMINARGQVKVMDFGLARLRGAARLTQTSSTVGTLAYMPPEAITRAARRMRVRTSSPLGRCCTRW